MNSQSPEDRLLDELLREQAKGPDEAFLKQIEAAVDAGPSRAAKRPATLTFTRLAIAAGLALVAGIFIWSPFQNRHSQSTVRAADRMNAEKEKAASEFEELAKSIRDQEDKVEERRKVLATIAAGSAGGGNKDVLPPFIGKLMYVKDESLAWVLRPGYGLDGRFPIKYEDSSRQTNTSGMVGPGDSFFLTGPMANRFKLLGSEVRRETNKAISIERDVTIVRVEDQHPNKKGMVYEFPSPLSEERMNQFVKYDRTAVFSLEVAGMEGKEFKVEENTAFSLPPGAEKKDYLLKSITPAGVVVEMVDGGQMVEISKGAIPAGEALGALAENSSGRPRGDIREEAIKRGLDAQDYADARRELETDQQQLQAMKSKLAELGSGSGGGAERAEIVSDTIAKKSLASNRVEAQKTVAAGETSVRRSLEISELEALPSLPPLAANDGILSPEARGGANAPVAGLGSGSGLGRAAGPSSQYGLLPESVHPTRQPRPRVTPAPGAVAGNDSMERPNSLLFGRDHASESNTGDRYGTFIDQPWKSPDRDPLSTFSIDVDTASYSNVRRMIQEGREIPRDAVRIEECINAFSYHYQQPKGDGPFAVSATLAACPWAPAHQLVRVAIKGREIETNKRPASNLVFLIDVSGSMQSPDKLPLLKQSMATLVEQLDERDRVAIVVYAGTEGVALPSTRLDAEGRATVLKSLGKLEAGGSTNGGAGIKRAYQIAMEQKIEGGVNRVILATDGDFNVGITGQESLVGLVKERAKSGVYLTVAGFGTGNLNDAMMDAITRDGNGNYFYIDSEREGRKVFLKNLTGTLVTIAKDVKIQVEFNPAKVGGYRLIGYSNRVLRNEDFANDKVDAGDIGAGHTVTAFYELTPPGAGTDNLKYQAAPQKPAAITDEWLTVKLRHKHPDGDDSRLIEFPLTGDPLALDKTDTDFQFATAAALFGMKLRGMEEVKDITWEKVLELAKPGLADDATEDRAEFVGLVRKLAGTRERVVPAPAEVTPVDR